MDANSTKIKGLLAFIKHPNTSQHERDTAQGLLNKLCAKYDINPNDLFDEVERTECIFKIPKEQWEKQLLIRLYWQISEKPADELSYTIKSRKGKAIEYGFLLSAACHLEFCEAYAFYKQLYKKELKKMQDSLFVAFVVKHDIDGIKSQQSKEEKESSEKMSIRDIEMFRSMINSLDNQKLNLKKRLNDGK